MEIARLGHYSPYLAENKALEGSDEGRALILAWNDAKKGFPTMIFRTHDWFTTSSELLKKFIEQYPFVLLLTLFSCIFVNTFSLDVLSYGILFLYIALIRRAFEQQVAIFLNRLRTIFRSLTPHHTSSLTIAQHGLRMRVVASNEALCMR